MGASMGTRILRAKAAPVSLRSSRQWQRKLKAEGASQVMTLAPQRQDD